MCLILINFSFVFATQIRQLIYQESPRPRLGLSLVEIKKLHDKERNKKRGESKNFTFYLVSQGTNKESLLQNNI